MGLVQLVILLLIIGGALYLLPRVTLDASIVAVLKVVLTIIAVVAVLLFAVEAYETSSIPMR